MTLNSTVKFDNIYIHLFIHLPYQFNEVPNSNEYFHLFHKHTSQSFEPKTTNQKKRIKEEEKATKYIQRKTILI